MTIRNEMTLATIEPNVGLGAALAGEPAAVVAAIKESGMKGRGGAGFPTGLKWQLAAAAPGESRYVVCNADEGEPGTFKDRVLLTEWPALVFEGMTIAGYAIGASEGVLYLRAEYLYLRPALEEVLEQRRTAGLLGRSVAGKPGFDFDIRIHLGAGAYVCGEETALIESIEGKRGEPRNRPPFPVTLGLNQLPTSVNNVETFAWAAAILGRGAAWFKAIGTPGSTGPKLLSISGDVARPGVYEFPFGVSVEQLLTAAGGEGAKAVIVGGASGTCVPAGQFSRKIAYEDAATGGAVMVLGPDRDLLDVAENFMEFFAEESCGQCAPCRIGNVKILEGVRAAKRGELSAQHLQDLLDLSATMKVASRCGLGQSSPNVFLAIVEHYQDEVLDRATFEVATVAA